MSKILILTATAGEQSALREALGGLERTVQTHRTRYYGKIFGRDITLIEGGLGAVNTAQALTAAIAAGGPDSVIQCGIAGAYPGSGLVIGDIAVAEEEIYGDLGIALPDRYALADEIGIPVIEGDPPCYNRMPLDPSLTKQAFAAAESKTPGLGCATKRGLFVTIQQCTGCAALAAELESRFSGLCENMEGAAAAHICALYDVPMAEVRGISNIVEDRDLSKWDIPLAAARAQSVVLTMLETMG